MKRVVIFGPTGMVGSMVHDVLRKDHSLETLFVDRATVAARDDLGTIGAAIYGADYVINCVGRIKPYINDADIDDLSAAIEANALFPIKLAQAAEGVWDRVDLTRKCSVLNIATDCVFNGDAGGYTEADPHDAHDIYGKTKSLGEVHSPHMRHMRCSVIGPEQKSHKSMLDWFLGNADGHTVKGFCHHEWNGITTLAYARICLGIIKNDLKLDHLQHVVPAGITNKSDLLRLIAVAYKRNIKVKTETAQWCDRTLDTLYPEKNHDLWVAAGYDGPPTIETMVAEMAGYKVGV